jgi:hypothetical protein
MGDSESASSSAAADDTPDPAAVEGEAPVDIHKPKPVHDLPPAPTRQS